MYNSIYDELLSSTCDITMFAESNAIICDDKDTIITITANTNNNNNNDDNDTKLIYVDDDNNYVIDTNNCVGNNDTNKAVSTIADEVVNK